MEIKYRNDLNQLLEHFNLTGRMAELGCAEGCSAEIWAKYDRVTKLYLIDNWGTLKQKGDGGFDQEWHDYNFSETKRKMEPFKERVEILKGLTGEMIQKIPDDSLIACYIDADHSYAGCLRDLEAIYSKVKVGGIISGHDYLNPVYGVNKAVADFTRDRFEVHTIEEDEMPMAGFWFIKTH